MALSLRAFRWHTTIDWWPGLTCDLLKHCGVKSEALIGEGTVLGFIDGGCQGFAQPDNPRLGRLSYSLYHGSSDLKYQTITTPDGLIIHISRAFIGSANGFTLYLWTSA